MGSPLAHTSTSFASEAWLQYHNITTLAKNAVRVLQGKAVHLDMVAKLLTYKTNDKETQTLPYDYAIIASGITRAWPVVPRAVNKALYLHDAQTFKNELSMAHRIALVGGGKPNLPYQLT